MKKYKLYILILLFVASAPRMVELLSGNFIFGSDQGLFFQAVKKIVVDHDLTLIGSEVGGAGGFFQGPGWYYLLSIPFFITSGHPYGAMVLMFLLGIITLVLTLYCAKNMFGYPTALAVALLIAVSPSIVPQSRMIWPPFVISPLTVLFLYSLYMVFREREHYLLLTTFTLGLMAHFEIAVAATLTLQLLLYSVVFFKYKLVRMRTVFLSIGTFLATQLPLIVFDLRHDFLITKAVVRLVTGADRPHAITRNFAVAMIQNHIDVFMRDFFLTFHFGSHLWPVLLLILLGGAILFLRDRATKRADKLFVTYLLTSAMTLFLVMGLYMAFIWQWWIIELSIMYCFLLGILLVYVSRYRYAFIATTLLLALFLHTHITQTVAFYRSDYFDYGGTHKMRGKLDALDYIYRDANGEKFGLLVYTPPVYTYPYDYLLWWHGQRNYNYIPHNEKRGLFYLLIEHDPNQPWTYKGWVETVVKEGHILETITLPSGFIVEKRILQN